MLPCGRLAAPLAPPLPLGRRRRTLSAASLAHPCLRPPQVEDLVPLIQDPLVELRGLKLRGCALDDDTAHLLSRSLSFNTTLNTLDLRDNGITGKRSVLLV